MQQKTKRMGTNIWWTITILLKERQYYMHRMYADFSDEAYEDMVNLNYSPNTGD